MITLYHETSFQLSKELTNAYSTSFGMGIKAFSRSYRDSIYSVYAYVRLADEIVDSFHGYNKPELMKRFREETFRAIEERISTNPVIHSFQLVVHKYNIGYDLIDAFLTSMEMDLEKSSYQRNVYDKYIYGSAEVVGLMCLKVFVNGNNEEYNQLLHPAKMLGSAFQKVNFLRDIKSDIDERGRIYLPNIHLAEGIDNSSKKNLENEVEEEFRQAMHGILKLPLGVRLGVYSAYLYYYGLFKKIKNLDVNELLKRRVRISNFTKLLLLLKSFWQIRVLRIS
ncbi:MAG: Phytoene synthetase [Ignavibacteria bacterium]|nr:MAG: Phytoene synthetase [Ignavibacteria bacterium]KAF0155682.1 MAG: Phytoene synthetase [Ignavibacteria bacterium]